MINIIIRIVSYNQDVCESYTNNFFKSKLDRVCLTEPCKFNTIMTFPSYPFDFNEQRNLDRVGK